MKTKLLSAVLGVILSSQIYAGQARTPSITITGLAVDRLIDAITWTQVYNCGMLSGEKLPPGQTLREYKQIVFSLWMAGRCQIF